MIDLMYKVQLPPDDGHPQPHWSEWRPVSQKITELHILSVVFDQAVGWDDPRYLEFIRVQDA